MDNVGIFNWKRTRSKGVLRYILVRGICLGIITTFLPYLLFREKIIFSELPIWIRLGSEILIFIFAFLVDWIINEFKYKKTTKEWDNK